MGISQTDIDQQLGESSTAQAPSSSAPTASPVETQATPPQSVETHGKLDANADIQRILGLSVPVTVVLADREMRVGMILATKVGTIIEFDVSFDAELTLHAANQPIGKGYAVKVGENFGLRITHVGSVAERIEAMSGDSSAR